jgi:hypothetical protein
VPRSAGGPVVRRATHRQECLCRLCHIGAEFVAQTLLSVHGFFSVQQVEWYDYFVFIVAIRFCVSSHVLVPVSSSLSTRL